MTRRQRILESNLGRDYGWYVELDGEVVAALVSPRPAGPSCDSYRLEPVTSDPAAQARLYTEAFWADANRLVFRNRWFGDVARRAVPCAGAGGTLQATGRLEIREL